MSHFSELLKTQRVLVIEDLAEMRSSLRSMLELLGAATIDVTPDGESALALLRKNPYQLILCDYELGKGKDGQQVLEEARSTHLIKATTSFVLVTAAQTIEMVMGALEYQPDGYIAKPITFDDFSGRLIKIIHRKQVFRAINRAMDAKNIVAALEACDALLAAKPHLTVATQRIKGKLLFDAGLFEHAQTLYEEVVTAHQLPWAQQGHAKCLYARGLHDDALFLLEDLIAANANYVECYDVLAKIHEKRGDFKRAQAVLEKAVDRSPKAVLRQTELSRVAAVNADWDVCVKASRKAVSLGRNSYHKSPDNLLNLARALQPQITEGGFRERTYATTEVAHTLAALTKEYGEDPVIGVQAALLDGLTQTHLGKEQEAAWAFEQAQTLAKGLSEIPPVLLATITETLVSCGQSEQADAFLEAVRALESVAEPERVRAEQAEQKAAAENCNDQAVRLFAAGNVEEALVLFRQATLHSEASVASLMNTVQALLVQARAQQPVDPQLLAECEGYFARLSEQSLDEKQQTRLQKLTTLFSRCG